MKKKLMMMAALLLLGTASSYGAMAAAWDFGNNRTGTPPAGWTTWTSADMTNHVPSTVGGLTLSISASQVGFKLSQVNTNGIWSSADTPLLTLVQSANNSGGEIVYEDYLNNLTASNGTTLTLSGLTPGLQYQIQFLSVFAPVTPLQHQTISQDGAAAVTINPTGTTNDFRVGYSSYFTFTATASDTDVSFLVLGDANANPTMNGIAGMMVNVMEQAGQYLLSVNSGTGSGLYTSGAQVAISADAPAYGHTFNQWIGDTQYVDSVTSPNATVTMSTNPVTLTATYKFADGFYALTVTGGTGGGVYPNGQQVAITATSVVGKVFSRWVGDTQYVESVTSANTAVTLPNDVITNAVNLVALNIVPALDGTVVAAWDFGNTRAGAVPTGWTTWSSADLTNNNLPSTVGSLTLTFSSTNVVAPFASVAAQTIGTTGVWGYVNAPLLALDTSITAQNVYEDFLEGLTTAKASKLTLSGLTDGRQYQIQFLSIFLPQTPAQLQNVKQDGISAASIDPAGFGTTADTRVIYSDYYNFTATATNTDVEFLISSVGNAGRNGLAGMMVREVNLVGSYTLTVNGGSGSGSYTNSAVVSIAADAPALGMTFDVWTGDTQGVASVSASNTTVTMPANAVALTATYKSAAVTLIASAGGNGTVSPASTNVVPGNSADFVITASNYYRIASLTTNGTPVTGMTFDNSSTTTNFTWSNVQTAGTVAATFTAQLAADPAGAPYAWLAGYGLTNYDTDAVADQDLDGLKTWQEYIAGTDPTNKASCLKVAQTNRNTVIWSAVPGRVYSVYWSTNLVKGFTNLASGIQYPQGSYTNTTPDAKVNHYQVKVQLQ